MEKTRVFLSDSQVLFREGIHFILSGEDDFEVIGETTGNEEAYTHIITNPPAIALLGMADATTSGAAIARRIKRNLPTVAVVLTIDEKNDETMFTAMKSGASACITKDTDPDYLLDLFRVISQGSYPIIEEMLSPGTGTMLLEEFREAAGLNEELGNLLPGLVPRELQLLNSVAAGNDMDQIAEKLAMNESDIRRSLRFILNKLINTVQAKELVEAVKSRYSPADVQRCDAYVTRVEFNELKTRFTELQQRLEPAPPIKTAHHRLPTG